MGTREEGLDIARFDGNVHEEHECGLVSVCSSELISRYSMKKRWKYLRLFKRHGRVKEGALALV